MLTDLDPSLDLVLERTIKAPRALVWECWTTPEHLVHWFVPKPHRVTACALDVRVGGKCNTTFEVEGAEMQNNGVYLEVIPGEKLVFTDTYTEGWKPAPEPFMTAILLFEDTEDGHTRYTAIARHRNTDTAEQHKQMGFYDGWGIVVTQLEAYAQGLQAEIDARTLVIERLIDAPVAAVWKAWTDPAALPLWWGPDGFSCRTQRIDLRQGGEWVFDMIGPDGTVFPNHHRYTRHVPQTRIDYTLLWGENGPKHADASALFEDLGGRTKVTLRMIMITQAESQQAREFGALKLGFETLGKLAHADAAG